MTHATLSPPMDSLLFVVDDDQDTRANLRDILEIDGYQIREAGSAAELSALTDWSQVSLILLDRKLSDGDSQQILPEIKRRAPNAAVIIITGYADLAGAVGALRERVSDYILKPVNADVLRASIRRELERQASESRLRALFNNSLDGILIFDRDQTILDANPAACEMLKQQLHELRGRRVDELIGAQAKALALESPFAAPHLATEVRLRRSDGSSIDIEHRIALNISPNVNALLLRDITERRRAEERALQAERLAAIGETMTALVHESRNALQRSFGCLEMLACEVEDRPEALSLIGRVQRAQNQLRQLYEEVRLWAAPINLDRERSDLAEVWRQAWQNAVQVQPERDLTLLEDITCDTVCAIDKSRMEQVFRNIFENALEVSPPTAHVTLRCENLATDNNYVRVTILDKGPGLTAEQQQRMFEPFFTTKTKGTGLGLSITQRIVQAHQGRIAATSPGGAQIEIVLPRG